MKNILLVDDEKNFILSLLDMFKHYEDSYRVHAAFNGKQAIDLLATEEIDLVVTDLKMPELDGFGLIAHMSKSHPATPIIVMTAFSTPETADRLDSFGIFQYIEKPVEFDPLLEKIGHTLAKGSKGHISGVSLASFLQLIGLDNKTCTIKVTAGDSKGVIYFQQGEIFDAMTGSLSGEEAAFEIVNWERVEIEIEEFCRKKEKRIASPLGFILIEAARRKDETQGPGEVNEEEKPAKQSPAAPAATATESGHAVAALVSTIQALGTVSSMVIAKRDGTFLAHHNISKKIAVYIVRMALEAEAMRPGFQKQGIKFLSLQHSPGRQLVILPSATLVVGLETDTSVAPAELAANLGPVVKRIKLA